VTGTGRRTLEWSVEAGRWGLVVMNADGHRGVRADVRIAAKGRLVPIGTGMLVAGLLLLGGAALGLRAALREGVP
jgi:hypothetical protein